MATVIGRGSKRGRLACAVRQRGAGFRAVPLFMPLIVLLMISGCAPGLGERFSVNTVEVVPTSVSAATLERVRFRWGTILDARKQTVVADINGRMLEPDTDPVLAARRIFEAQFRESGVRASLFEGPVVDLELLDWMIEIQPGFPSTKMDARASVRVKVAPESASSSYSARYSGTVSVEHPIGSTERIQSVFAQAMAEAASQAISDQHLIDSIRVPG